MAAQAALIEETIIGLKKALRRENEHSGPDEAITQPTNRGNKLKLNANHVHEGVLGFTDPLNLYKQKIDHAGYTRYILHRNPPRYDSEGDEIEGQAEEDADSETAAEANEDNPFAGIALEHVLCPLKQASELPDHPTLSQPYRSKALSTMIRAIEEKLRKERALLARAHNLHRLFLGDSVWMPCGAVESKEDPYIFIPRVEKPSNRQVTNEDADMQDKSVGNNSNGDSSGVDTTSSNPDERHEEDGIEMTGGPRPDTMKGEETRESKTEETTRNGSRPIEHGAGHSISADSISSAANGNLDKPDKGADTMASLPPAAEATGEDIPMQDAPEIQDSKVKDATSSPEPPRRMTTRARANASTGGENEGTIGSSSRYTSPGAITNSSTAHPLFLLSDNIRPDKDFGLPPNEAEDTRRLLWSYIQKQEETVRGFTYMLKSLLRAEQLKENVFDWCKAEGHIGEMSDGEDWYDREKWGFTDGEDLKKGADDDDAENAVTEERTTGKRGRRRQ